jgi:hypothetical protein
LGHSLNKNLFPIPFLSRVKPLDWKLLVFLILFVNVKLLVKVAAILLIYLLRPNAKAGFSWKHSRLPFFYPAMMAIAVINWVLQKGFLQMDSSILLLVALFYWTLCILAIHQVKLSVEQQDTETLHRTVEVFFVINLLISFITYAYIVGQTGTLNPYRYQGEFQKYFIGTGDYIKGLSFDTSTTNAVLNAFGVLYFLQRNKYLLAIFCMAALLLTGSNLMNLLLGGVLLYLFFFKTAKAQKSVIVVCLLLMVLFWAKVSPQNNRYITEAISRFSKKPVDRKASNATPVLPLRERPDSLLSTDERKEKLARLYLDSMRDLLLAKSNKLAIATEKPLLPQANIHSANFQHKNDTTNKQRQLMQWMQQDSVNLAQAVVAAKPGKWVALQQVVQFVRTHPMTAITGAGAGHFSSKLAFRATGLNIAGSYPSRFAYIDPRFKEGHLALYLYYFTKTAGLHSLTNSPNTVYGQVLSEYGLLGILALLVLYGGFFAKQYKKMTYGIPLLMLMVGVFFIDYWFEQLSVMVVWELLLLLNIKEGTRP